MTGKQIQEIICKCEVLKFNIPCENVSVGMSEADVLSLNKSGYLTEFEVKISRPDFLADKKKSKWVFFNNRIESQIPNYFYYVCPNGLINVDEIPSYSGLIYIEDESIKLIRKAKILHKKKKPIDKILRAFSRVFSERFYLGSCRITYENKLRKERYKKYEQSINIYN